MEKVETPRRFKTFREFKKGMKAKAEEHFKVICQLAPELKPLLSVGIVKEAMLAGWACGFLEGVRQTRIEIDKQKKCK